MSSYPAVALTTCVSNHSPAIVDSKDVNDEFVAYLVRCCDDPKTDSWVTLSVLLTDDAHDTALQAHIDRVANMHACKQSRISKAQAKGILIENNV